MQDNIVIDATIVVAVVSNSGRVIDTIESIVVITIVVTVDVTIIITVVVSVNVSGTIPAKRHQHLRLLREGDHTQLPDL